VYSLAPTARHLEGLAAVGGLSRTPWSVLSGGLESDDVCGVSLGPVLRGGPPAGGGPWFKSVSGSMESRGPRIGRNCDTFGTGAERIALQLVHTPTGTNMPE
jgi:hypothetical protein